MNIRIESSSLTDANISGVGNYTKMLCNGFTQYSAYKVECSYFNFLNRKKLQPISAQKRTQKKILPLKIFAKLDSYGFQITYDKFMSNVDLTIFPNFALWKTTHSKKTATVIHDLTYIYYPDTVERKNLGHLRRVVPRAINKSDFIITVSNSVKKDLIDNFNIDENRCIVTPIPPDDSFYRVFSSSDINSVKAKYGITKSYLYFIGNFEPRKNLNTLVSAYLSLPISIKSKYSLVIAGSKGWNNNETMQLVVQSQEAGEDIRLIGFIDQEDSPALYQGAEMLILPSIYEGFGIPLVEAMASKCALIVSDIPVFREVTGGYADFFNPADYKQLRNKILSNLEENNSNKENIRLAYKKVRTTTWKDNVKKVEKLIS